VLYMKIMATIDRSINFLRGFTGDNCLHRSCFRAYAHTIGVTKIPITMNLKLGSVDLIFDLYNKTTQGS